jgi:D-amino-acid dehydrogenase
MHILVAGAGIVGISTAIWLQRAGHSVTVVDRAQAGSGTSHGNGGVLAAGAVVPVTTPGLAAKAPAMLMNRDAPLFLRWSYLPRLMPFLLRYLRHATDAHVDRYGAAMSALLHDSVAQHMALAADTPAAQYITTEDYCFGYARRADYDADSYGWAKRAAQGVRTRVVSGAEYAAYDPLFGDAFETVVRCEDHGRISDPGAYVAALGDHFVAQGGTLHRTDITDIEMTEGAVTALITADGPLRADKIVFAMGPWSRAIAHKLGVKVPFESERGYHIELVNPSAMARAPMMVASGKFVLTPMQGRIRAAGVIEFGGLDAPASRAPLEMLHRQLARLLPDVRYDSTREWMGHRPAPADSLPLIGANDAGGASYSAFGHQHVGLTGGPKTGRMIAELISGRVPNMDMRPFDPAKYKGRQSLHIRDKTL